MPELLITCANPACAQPLKLPSEAIGQPLSCPYCRAELKVTLNEGGGVAGVEMLRKGGLRVPRQFLVPGFALLILGLAGILVNGFIAVKCRTDDEFTMRYARNRARDLRNGEETGMLGDEKKRKEATSDELFGAIAGSAAAYSVSANAEELTAIAWAPWIYPSRFVAIGLGAITALGGYCILRGKGYAAAMIGCFAAVLNINELGCCFPGALAGGWGILMLVRDDGRRYFRIAPRAAG